MSWHPWQIADYCPGCIVPRLTPSPECEGFSAAGLLVRTFQKLVSMNLGIDKSALVEVSLAPRPNGYRNLDMNEYHQQLVERISAIPGVRSVSFSDVSVPRQE